MVKIAKPKPKRKKGNPTDVRIALELVDEFFDLVKRPLPILKLGRTTFDLGEMYRGFAKRVKDEIQKRPDLVTEALDRLERALAKRKEAKKATQA